MDDCLDILSISRIHPHIYFLMREDDWHAVMNLRELRSGIFGQNDNFILRCIQSCNQEVVALFGSKAEWLFLFTPFVISFQNDNTSILDNINKHPLIEQFLNPPIDHHTKFTLMPPLHIGQLSMILILHRLIVYLLLLMLLHVEAVWLDNRDISGWADVV